MSALVEVKSSFEATANNPQYQAINRRHVNDYLDTRPGQRILDLGSGTGLTASFIALRFNGVPVEIIGIEPNPESIKKARQEVKSVGQTEINFIEASGQYLLSYIEPGSVDQVFSSNNIHELENEGVLEETLRQAALALREGGKFVANSTFMAESMPLDDPEFMRPMGEWKLTAKNILRAGRDKNKKSFITYPLEYYKKRFGAAGLEVVSTRVVRVNVTPQLLKAIAKYETFIHGISDDFLIPDDVLPPGEDYEKRRIKIVSEALIAAVDVLVQKHKEKYGPDAEFTVPRNWVEIVARKPRAEDLSQAA